MKRMMIFSVLLFSLQTLANVGMVICQEGSNKREALQKINELIGRKNTTYIDTDTKLQFDIGKAISFSQVTFIENTGKNGWISDANDVMGCVTAISK